MIRIQCLSSAEDIFTALGDEDEQRHPFEFVCVDLLKTLKSKENRTDEETLFLEYTPGELHYNWHLYDVSFCTVFTRMFPTLIFRVFNIKFDFMSGETYIFKGDQYAFEGNLPNFDDSRQKDTIIKIEGCPIEFKMVKYRPYSAEALRIPCEITCSFMEETYIYGNGDDFDQELPYKKVI